MWQHHKIEKIYWSWHGEKKNVIQLIKLSCALLGPYTFGPSMWKPKGDDMKKQIKCCVLKYILQKNRGTNKMANEKSPLHFIMWCEGQIK